MYLSDLCSGRNAVFTGFLRFLQLYPPETKTPLGARVITPNFRMVHWEYKLRTHPKIV